MLKFVARIYRCVLVRQHGALKMMSSKVVATIFSVNMHAKYETSQPLKKHGDALYCRGEKGTRWLNARKPQRICKNLR